MLDGRNNSALMDTNLNTSTQRPVTVCYVASDLTWLDTFLASKNRTVQMCVLEYTSLVVWTSHIAVGFRYRVT